MCSDTIRLITSLGPPAANGTISVIGREGNGASACAEFSIVSIAVATMAGRMRFQIIGLTPYEGGRL